MSRVYGLGCSLWLLKRSRVLRIFVFEVLGFGCLALDPHDALIGCSDVSLQILGRELFLRGCVFRNSGLGLAIRNVPTNSISGLHDVGPKP